MTWVAAAVAAASAGVGTYRYLHAKSQAKKNVRPLYGTWGIDAAQQNLDLLNNTMGLPPSVVAMLLNRNGQAQSAGLDTIKSFNGNPNLVSQVLQQGYIANQDIGLQDALQRKNDIAGIVQARMNLSNERDKRFQINELNKYKDLATALSAEEAAGFSQIGGAANSLSSAFANKATADLAKQYGDEGLKTSYGSAGSDSNITTPNSGVNVNKLYQQLYGNRQSPFVNQNNMTIGNIGQAPQYNFNGQIPFNANNQYPYFSQYPYFNPSSVSLFNNPYSLSF